MLCTVCGQDVPVVPTAEDPEVVTCMRCRASFALSSDQDHALRVDHRHTASVGKSNEANGRREPPPLIADDDDWDDMYAPSNGDDYTVPSSHARTYRVDRNKAATAIARTPAQRRHRSSWVQWLILSLGAGLFSCGAALIAWSFGEDRQDLWNIGAPMALAGQAAFLIGLVLQLDVIWQQSKLTSHRLHELDQRVSPLPDSVGGVNAGVEDGATFRTLSATDAESLLSDLKGQLDRMATRLTRHKA